MNILHPFSISDLELLLSFDWNYLRKLRRDNIIKPYSNKPFHYSWYNLISACFLFFLNLDVASNKQYNLDLCRALGEYLTFNHKYLNSGKVIAFKASTIYHVELLEASSIKNLQHDPFILKEVAQFPQQPTFQVEFSSNHPKLDKISEKSFFEVEGCFRRESISNRRYEKSLDIDNMENIPQEILDEKSLKISENVFFYYLHLERLINWLIYKSKDKEQLQKKVIYYQNNL